MKTLSISELDTVAEAMQTLVGSPLQKVLLSGGRLYLGFWQGSSGLGWVMVDMKPSCPLLLGPIIEAPPKAPKEHKPIQLFLKAHFEGVKLESVERVQELGRVLVLGFTRGLRLEVRLLPHGQNMIAQTPEKSLSWNPVKDLAPGAISGIPSPGRSLSELIGEWRQMKPAGSKKVLPGAAFSRESAERLHKQKLAKLEKALTKLDEDIQKKDEAPYRKIGEYLNEQQSLDVPEKWSSFVDRNISLSENINFCFTRAKELKLKAARGKARREELRAELSKLQMVEDKLQWAKVISRSSPGKVNSKGPSFRGRKLQLSCGAEAFIGKSAADNLKLLRRARAWDIWIHLKDHHGSHGIVHRSKAQVIPEADLLSLANKIVETTFGQKAKDKQGESFELLIAECRFVRPIKGDRLGRVNYRNERALHFTYQPD